MEVLLLGIKPYDFKNDDGERVSGNKVFYITEDKIDGIVGHAPMIISVGEDVVPFITVLPAIYNLNCTTKVGRNNKAELVVKGATLVSEVKNLFAKATK